MADRLPATATGFNKPNWEVTLPRPGHKGTYCIWLAVSQVRDGARAVIKLGGLITGFVGSGGACFVMLRHRVVLCY